MHGWMLVARIRLYWLDLLLICLSCFSLHSLLKCAGVSLCFKFSLWREFWLFRQLFYSFQLLLGGCLVRLKVPTGLRCWVHFNRLEAIHNCQCCITLTLELCTVLGGLNILRRSSLTANSANFVTQIIGFIASMNNHLLRVHTECCLQIIVLLIMVRSGWSLILRGVLNSWLNTFCGWTKASLWKRTHFRFVIYIWPWTKNIYNNISK